MADGTLLINAPSESSVGLALQAECPSADRIDLLCAFIKWSGLRLLQEQLSAHLSAGRPLRVLTTVYMGATDRRALDWLVANKAQVRVSSDTRRTRLHAKAWLFHRASGASTAYIGSSNLSAAALLDGLEWNVRLAALETPAMLSKFQDTPASGLVAWLEALAMEPAEFYGIRGAAFAALRRELGWLTTPPHPEEERLTRAIASGLLHFDDPDRLRATAAALAAPVPPDPEALGERERRGWRMLFAQLLADHADHRLPPLPWALQVPLRVHGRYSRAEVLAAYCCAEALRLCCRRRPRLPPQPPRPGQPGSAPSTMRRGGRGCCCSCGSSAGSTGAMAVFPNRSAVWGLPPTRATRESGSGLSKRGDSPAAGAEDSGGVVARLLLGIAAGLAV